MIQRIQIRTVIDRRVLIQTSQIRARQKITHLATMEEMCLEVDIIQAHFSMETILPTEIEATKTL